MYRAAISFTAPYRVYLPDEFFSVLTSTGTALVKALPLPPAAIQEASQVHGSDFEVDHDIFGFAGRTRFHVVLDSAIDVSQAGWKMTVCNQDKAILASALDIVNRLLAVYRDRDANSLGTQSFHVIELVRGDISDIELVVIDAQFNRIEDFSVAWPGYRSMGFGTTTERAEGVLEALRADLAANAEIPIERELITSARNHLWRNQLRLVPVDANTAFESYALVALRRIDPYSMLPDSSDICTKLSALERALAQASAAQSLAFSPWFDTAVPGWKGLLNSELLRWHGDCYALRNKVIHRGFNQVGYADAKNALDSAVSAMGFIENKIARIAP